MAKQITFPYNGKDYTLEFSRNVVSQMERRGFVIDDIDEKPVSVITDLFAGAFIVHHPSMKRNTVEKIYDNMRDKKGLLRALVAMYDESRESLMDDEGNADWTPNWEIEEE